MENKDRRKDDQRPSEPLQWDESAHIGGLTDERIDELFAPVAFPPAPVTLRKIARAIEREVLATGKVDSYRQFVEEWATKAGWKREEGEGAFEYVQRISYEQGFADQRRKPEYAASQAWNGELPKPDVLGAGVALGEAVHSYSAEAVRKAIGAAVAGVRDKALEEAAIECTLLFTGLGGPPDDPHPDAVIHNGAINDCANAIRALKSQPAAHVPDNELPLGRMVPRPSRSERRTGARPGAGRCDCSL